MIELGNLLYGNSRGRYVFPDRALADSRSWTGLLDSVHADAGGCLLRAGRESSRYGNSIVRDAYGGFAFRMPDGTILFEIFPYYWGEDEKLRTRHNFVYKPGTEDEFAIDWYKYPFRDAYMSKPASKTMLKRMFEECTQAVMAAQKGENV